MPSPLGHALGGFAAGWLVAGPPQPAGIGPSSNPSAAGPGIGQSAGVGQRVTRARAWRRLPPRALAFAALGMAADLDLLIGQHSGFTHSVGMTAIVGILGYAALRTRHAALGARSRLILAVGVAAAFGSHLLLDWLAADATPPWGIKVLWPFSSSYSLSGLDVFWGISREPWRPGAAWHDVLAIAREFALLGPLAALAWWLRSTPRQILPAAADAGPQQLPTTRRLPADGESN